jgi:catechol 2,3-dioxygenase-like lactoylglutathione lyase family enzyme
VGVSGTGPGESDQEAAIEFYTNKLGFDKIRDEPYGGGARGSEDQDLPEEAAHNHEKALGGKSDGSPILTLGTGDIHAAYERLQERGVRFLHGPARRWFLDQDGSPILLRQELLISAQTSKPRILVAGCNQG